MTTIESNTTAIESSQEKVFNFLCDFNNYPLLMPSSVKDWKCTKDTCSFKIGGMAEVGLKIVGTTPNEKVAMVSDGGKIPFQFTLDALVKKTGEHTSTGQLIFNGDIPIFIRPMVTGPLTEFFNILAERMSQIK